MELVRAAFGHDIYNRALVAAVLRREVVGDELKLLHGVLVVDKEIRTANGQVVIVRAVECKVILPRTVAVD